MRSPAPRDRDAAAKGPPRHQRDGMQVGLDRAASSLQCRGAVTSVKRSGCSSQISAPPKRWRVGGIRQGCIISLVPRLRSPASRSGSAQAGPPPSARPRLMRIIAKPCRQQQHEKRQRPPQPAARPTCETDREAEREPAASRVCRVSCVSPSAASCASPHRTTTLREEGEGKVGEQDVNTAVLLLDGHRRTGRLE